eukprot:jgi/Botrbrau1/14930/Bobra.0018s0034.1
MFGKEGRKGVLAREWCCSAGPESRQEHHQAGVGAPHGGQRVPPCWGCCPWTTCSWRCASMRSRRSWEPVCLTGLPAS